MSFIARLPLISLDMWAIRRFADDVELGKALVNTLARHGTICFSLMDLVEIGKTSGKSLDSIHGLLEQIGRHWAPLDCNPTTVAARDAQGADNPWLSATLRRRYLESSGRPILTYSNIIKILGQTDAACRTMHAKLETEVAPFVQMLGLCRLGRVRKIIVPQHGPTAERLELAVISVIQGELAGPPIGAQRHVFNGNDMVDMFRTIVTLAHLDFGLLDGSWCDRAAKARRLVPSKTQVFGPGNLQEFLSAFADWSRAKFP